MVDISHPLDFERAAATATGERFREAFDRYRIGAQRRGGVGEANVTKTRRSPHFEGEDAQKSRSERGVLTARSGVFDSRGEVQIGLEGDTRDSKTVGLGVSKRGSKT